MDPVRLRAAVRFESGWWRRFAKFGCVCGPERWKRAARHPVANVSDEQTRLRARADGVVLFQGGTVRLAG